MKFTNAVEFDTTIDGVDICISFVRTTVVGYENYGADADGNRGVWTLMVDSDEFSEVKVDFGGPPMMIPLDVLQLPTAQRCAVEAAIQTYMEEHDAEVPEEEERDPDEERDFDDA